MLQKLTSLVVIVDSKLNFNAHIDCVHQKYEKAMNSLKVDREADRCALLRLYFSFFILEWDMFVF